MEKNRTALANVPESNEYEATINAAMADAKEMSKKRVKEIEKGIATRRKESGATAGKPFTGRKKAPKEGKDLILSEAYEPGKDYRDAVMEQMEMGCCEAEWLVLALLKWMSMDDVYEFYDFYVRADAFCVDGEEDLDEAVHTPITDDDGEEYDMHTFITGLFSDSGEKYRKVDPKIRGGRFEHNARAFDSEDVNNLVFPIFGNIDGDVVISAREEKRFDKAKEVCDRYGLDYDIIKARESTKSPNKYDMVIYVPFDEKGNPLSVERYFTEMVPELGINPRTLVKGQERKNNKRKNA